VCSSHRHVNALGEDTDVWQPLLPEQIASWPEWQRRGVRVVLSTPLKLLSSIGSWAGSWGGFDLKNYHKPTRRWMLLSWAVPFAFMGIAWPAMLAAGGLGAWVTYWLMPWLVFHGWLSLLTLMQHTAPHIPWQSQVRCLLVGWVQSIGVVCLLTGVRVVRVTFDLLFPRPDLSPLLGHLGFIP